jgi:hypothetical protein
MISKWSVNLSFLYVLGHTTYTDSILDVYKPRVRGVVLALYKSEFHLSETKPVEQNSGIDKQ